MAMVMAGVIVDITAAGITAGIVAITAQEDAGVDAAGMAAIQSVAESAINLGVKI